MMILLLALAFGDSVDYTVVSFADGVTVVGSMVAVTIGVVRTLIVDRLV